MIQLHIVENPETADPRLHQFIHRCGIDPVISTSIAEAKPRLLQNSGGLVIADDVLPDGKGVDLVEGVDDAGAWSLILMGGAGGKARRTVRRDTSVIRHVTKPVDCKRLLPLLNKLEKRPSTHASTPCSDAAPWGIVGESPAIHDVRKLITMAGPTDAPVLIYGASGTGKELVARALHEVGNHRNGPFVAINCGAIASTLIDSELFGHVKGAFTGAMKNRRGVFEMAGSGTLFLDEVTEMLPSLQARLLRVLETRRVTPVGGDQEIPIKCRIVAATNRQPEECVRTGHLREDLYYRLSVIPISLPPLSERDGDIEILAERFLQELNTRYRASKRFNTDALQAIRAHSWPGNIRELRNAVHRSFIMAGPTIEATDLPIDSATNHNGRCRNFVTARNKSTERRAGVSYQSRR